MKKKTVIILICTIAIVTLGIISYIFLMNNKKNVDEESEKYSVKLVTLNDYLSNISISFFDKKGVSFTQNDIDKDLLEEYIYFVYKDVFERKEKISDDDMANFLIHLFGKNFKFTNHNMLYSENQKDYCLKYDQTNKEYEYTCKIEKAEQVKYHQVISVNETSYSEDKVFYIEAHIFNFKDGKVYNNYADMIAGNNSIYDYDINDNSTALRYINENASQFASSNHIRKIGLKYQDGNYYLQSFEIIK